MRDAEKALYVAKKDVLNELSKTLSQERAEALVNYLTSSAIDAAVEAVPSSESEVRLMAGEIEGQAMLDVMAVLGGTTARIRHLNVKPDVRTPKPDVYIKVDDAHIEFGTHTLKSKLGTGPFTVRAERSGYSPDIMLSFDLKDFDNEVNGWWMSEDSVFIQSVNDLFKSFGYKGPNIDRAEMGMQCEFVVFVEGGREFSEWMESIGWVNIDKAAKKPKIG